MVTSKGRLQLLMCPPLRTARVACCVALQGVDLTDDELMEYISESTTMSKAMEEYGDRKSCAITTAKRLALFLGEHDRINRGGQVWKKQLQQQS